MSAPTPIPRPGSVLPGGAIVLAAQPAGDTTAVVLVDWRHGYATLILDRLTGMCGHGRWFTRDDIAEAARDYAFRPTETPATTPGTLAENPQHRAFWIAATRAAAAHPDLQVPPDPHIVPGPTEGAHVAATIHITRAELPGPAACRAALHTGQTITPGSELAHAYTRAATRRIATIPCASPTPDPAVTPTPAGAHVSCWIWVPQADADRITTQAHPRPAADPGRENNAPARSR